MQVSHISLTLDSISLLDSRSEGFVKTTKYQKTSVIKSQAWTAAEVYSPWGSGSAIGEGGIPTVVFLPFQLDNSCPLKEKDTKDRA